MLVFFFFVENLAEKNLSFFMLGEKRDVDGGSYSFLFLIDYRNKLQVVCLVTKNYLQSITKDKCKNWWEIEEMGEREKIRFAKKKRKYGWLDNFI